MKKYLPIILVVAGLLMAFNKPIMGFIAPADLQISINKPPVIMPAIYKVYENEEALNGKYSLFQMVITNNSSIAAKNVEVSYSVSNYIDQTVLEKIPLIQPGQTVVVNCYPRFPDKIVDKMTDSKETVKITVKGPNTKTQENNFSIDMKGRNAFMYTFINKDEIRTAGEYFDNMPLLTCMITPEDPIVKYYTNQIQEKILKGEVTNEKSPEECIRFMEGIYNATLLAHTVYSSTGGVPESINDVNAIVQNIRLPREVITGKTGLCIELTLLYASVMAAAGLDAVVYLVPGHAYPGFVLDGHYYAIESTAIGGEGIGGSATAPQALEMGTARLKQDWPKLMSGDKTYNLIRVKDAIKNGAVAMELKDDNFLRTKVDEIAAKFDPAAAHLSNNVPANYGVDNNGGGGGGNGGGGNGGGNGGGGNGGAPNGYRMFQDVVTFAVPASWHQVPRSQYTVPQSRYVFANKNNTADVEEYAFPGYTNPEQALIAINQWVNKFGYSLHYQTTGQANGYTVFSGQTLGANGGLNWAAAFKATSNGVVGIATGANINTGSAYKQTVMTILNSLQ